MDWQAFALTIRLSITTAILLVVSVPLAALLVLGRSRWLAAVEALATLPLVLPPTVLGFFLLVLLGPRTAVGRGITTLLGHPLAFSFSGLVVGSVIYSLPFAVQPLVAGFSAVEPALVDAARLLGAGPARLVFSLLLPLARRSLLTAAVLSFLHTMGEFGVVLMLGGDIPGATRTLSIVLYNQVEAFDYAAANRTAATLLGLSVMALAAIYAGAVNAEGAMIELALDARRGSFHLQVECRFASEWTVIFGPSGAGKSTLLRLLSGLPPADCARTAQARIALDGRLLTDSASGLWLRPGQRQTSLVAQQAALFPHLSVAANVAYGLHGLDRAARLARVEEALQLVGAKDLMGRRPRNLSGGEAQRVALARALAPSRDCFSWTSRSRPSTALPATPSSSAFNIGPATPRPGYSGYPRRHRCPGHGRRGGAARRRAPDCFQDPLKRFWQPSGNGY